MWRLAHFLLWNLSGAGFRVRRHFSNAGLLAIGALVVSAAFGVDTTQSLAYQIFTFMLALLALSLAAAAFLRQRLEMSRELPPLVTAGEPFEYRLRVRNAGRRALDGIAVREDLADPRPTLAQCRASMRWPTYRGWWKLIQDAQPARIDEVALPRLAAGDRAEVTARGVALHRGIVASAGLSALRCEPLGIARAATRVRAPSRTVVLPRRHALPPFALPGSRKYQPGGVSFAQSVGNSEEFVSLREYRPGDPLQRIHWRSFARTGVPIVREYQDEFFERHALALDTFAPPSAAFEEGISVAASFAFTIDTQESLLDLVFVGEEAHCFTAGRGQLQARHLLEILAGVRASPAGDFARLANAVVARRTQLTGAILVLLAWDDARRELVARLGRLGVPVLALLVSEEEPRERPAALRLLRPSRMQQDLAAL